MVHPDKGTLLPTCTHANSNAERRSPSRSRINSLSFDASQSPGGWAGIIIPGRFLSILPRF